MCCKGWIARLVRAIKTILDSEWGDKCIGFTSLRWLVVWKWSWYKLVVYFKMIIHRAFHDNSFKNGMYKYTQKSLIFLILLKYSQQHWPLGFKLYYNWKLCQFNIFVKILFTSIIIIVIYIIVYTYITMRYNLVHEHLIKIFRNSS